MGFMFVSNMAWLHNVTLPRKDWRSTIPQLADLWDDFYEAELLPEEDVRTILRGARVISVIPCACHVRTGACRQVIKVVLAEN